MRHHHRTTVAAVALAWLVATTPTHAAYPDNTDIDLLGTLLDPAGHSQSQVALFDAETDRGNRTLVAFVEYDAHRILFPPSWGYTPVLKVYFRDRTNLSLWTQLLAVTLPEGPNEFVTSLQLTTAAWIDGASGPTQAPRQAALVVTYGSTGGSGSHVAFFSGPTDAAWSVLPGGLPAHVIFDGQPFPFGEPREMHPSVAMIPTVAGNFSSYVTVVALSDYNTTKISNFIRLIEVVQQPNQLMTTRTVITGPGSATGYIGDAYQPNLAADSQNGVGFLSFHNNTQSEVYTFTPVAPRIWTRVGTASVAGGCFAPEIKAQGGNTTMTCLGTRSASYPGNALHWFSVTGTAGVNPAYLGQLHTACATSGDIDLFRDDAFITAACYTGSVFGTPRLRALAFEGDRILGTLTVNGVAINDAGLAAPRARPRAVSSTPGLAPEFHDYFYSTGGVKDIFHLGSKNLLYLDPF